MSHQATLEYRTCARLAPGVIETVGYREEGIDPGVHVGVPSPSLTLVFSTRHPLEVSSAEGDVQADIVLGGLHVTPAQIAQGTSQSGIQLAIHPLASRRLFGMPASALTAVALDGQDVLGAAGRRLWHQVAESGSWQQAFGRVRDFVVQKWSDGEAAPRSEIVEAWRLLARRDGAVPIPEVAAHVGLSQRHLTTVFHHELGRSPKTVARLLRFRRAKIDLVDRVAVRRSATLAEVAHECGYTDHPHLVRDFQEFTGLSPTQWLDSERQIVQATAPSIAPE